MVERKMGGIEISCIDFQVIVHIICYTCLTSIRLGPQGREAVRPLQNLFGIFSKSLCSRLPPRQPNGFSPNGVHLYGVYWDYRIRRPSTQPSFFMELDVPFPCCSSNKSSPTSLLVLTRQVIRPFRMYSMTVSQLLPCLSPHLTF